VLNAVPTVSWAILAVVWFGVNDIAVVAVIVAILVPFTMVTVWTALLTLDEELYEMAKRKSIPGRSKMGKSDLIQAIRMSG